MDIQTIKQRFGIIGDDPALNRAINIAAQVASTDLSVLITGESGVGKEFFPKIIHQLSARKHGPYIAINCGAIPAGTIDSELFGHEKGAFTDAKDTRKGYFEVAAGGTIFLDEVAELPLETQVRLLRVLESGEFFKVGSSKTQKIDVRVVAATNVNVQDAISRGKFREDLFYRLNAISIQVPPLRDRKGDIELLFRKFASDICERYRMPIPELEAEARDYLLNYRWKGNIRQLKNVAEQIAVTEANRKISAEALMKCLPPPASDLPMLYPGATESLSEREILYSVLFDMRKEVNDLKAVISNLLKNNETHTYSSPRTEIKQIAEEEFPEVTILPATATSKYAPAKNERPRPIQVETTVEAPEEESLSLTKKEMDMIKKSLDRHRGKRRAAAEELGISERTLYRKIKEYGLE